MDVKKLQRTIYDSAIEFVKQWLDGINGMDEDKEVEP